MGQETSSPSAFYRILVLVLLLMSKVLKQDHFEEYALQKDDQQAEKL